MYSFTKNGKNIAIINIEKRMAMNRDDHKILKDVQKNTDMSLSAIETMSEKISNDELLHEISRQRILYSN